MNIRIIRIDMIDFSLSQISDELVLQLWLENKKPISFHELTHPTDYDVDRLSKDSTTWNLG